LIAPENYSGIGEIPPPRKKERGGERNPPSVPWEAACNLLHQRLSGLRGRRRLSLEARLTIQ